MGAWDREPQYWGTSLKSDSQPPPHTLYLPGQADHDMGTPVRDFFKAPKQVRIPTPFPSLLRDASPPSIFRNSHSISNQVISGNVVLIYLHVTLHILALL